MENKKLLEIEHLKQHFPVASWKAFREKGGKGGRRRFPSLLIIRMDSVLLLALGYSYVRLQ